MQGNQVEADHLLLLCDPSTGFRCAEHGDKIGWKTSIRNPNDAPGLILLHLKSNLLSNSEVTRRCAVQACRQLADDDEAVSLRVYPGLFQLRLYTLEDDTIQRTVQFFRLDILSKEHNFDENVSNSFRLCFASDHTQRPKLLSLFAAAEMLWVAGGAFDEEDRSVSIRF